MINFISQSKLDTVNWKYSIFAVMVFVLTARDQENFSIIYNFVRLRTKTEFTLTDQRNLGR
jgi:hypothetical protein